MYFIFDYSFFFLKSYRRNLSQMDQLRREHARAIAAYNAKSDFLSIVSHELRTPITSVKGSLNLVCSGRMGELPEGVSRMLTIANNNAERLANLIDDLLDFQAIEAGKLGMTFEDVALYPLVQDCIEATSGYLKEKGVQVGFLGNAEDPIVSADQKRLAQVLANVLSNAIKFSSDGGSVEVGLATQDGYAIVTIRDYGRGIPEGSEERVFAAFSQIDATNARSVNGTGLGMAVSKKIMTDHCGDIKYESTLGVGTVFRVSLPLVSTEARHKERSQSLGDAGRPDDGGHLPRVA